MTSHQYCQKKIILTTYSEADTSDISEKKRKKKVKDVTLYLDSQDELRNVLWGYISRKISKQELETKLITLGSNYDMASMTIKIGNSTSRTIDCNDLLDKLVDYDITSKVLSKKNGKYYFDSNKLIEICNNYASMVYLELVKLRKGY